MKIFHGKSGAWLLAIAAAPLLASCGGGKDSTDVFLEEAIDAKIVPVSCFEAEGKFGYVDAQGKLAIPAKFKDAYYFHEGVALVQDTAGLYGYIKPDGSYAIEPKYASAAEFTQGLAWVALPDSSLMAIDTKGAVKFRFPKAFKVDAFTNSLAIYTTVDGKKGLINTKGEEITLVDEFKDFTKCYDNKLLGETTGGKTVIGKIANGTLEPIDIPGNPDIEEVNLEKGLAIFYVDGKRGVMNFKGEYIINPRYKKLGFDGSDLIIFENDKEKYGWLNLKGEEVIPAKYKAVSALFGKKDYAIVSTSGSKYQTINRKGETIIKPKYERIVPFALCPDVLGIIDDKQVGLLSLDGKVLCEPQFKDINTRSKYVILATSGDYKFGVINEAGQYQGPVEYSPSTMVSVSATSQYVSAADIVSAVMDLKAKAQFGISCPDIALEFGVSKYDVDFYLSLVVLKTIKLPGAEIGFTVFLDNSAITPARSKSYSKFNPKAKPMSYTVSIVFNSETKCDEVFAALEKATGLEGIVGDLQEAMDFEDVSEKTIYYNILPNEQYLCTYK